MGFIIGMSLIGLLALIVIWFLVTVTLENRRDNKAPISRREKAELLLARKVIANVKELAYDYRDLDTNLSYRLLDTIAEYERKKELP